MIFRAIARHIRLYECEVCGHARSFLFNRRPPPPRHRAYCPNCERGHPVRGDAPRATASLARMIPAGLGEFLVELGSTVKAADYLADSNGRAVVTTDIRTAFGVAMESGAAGDLIRVRLII